MNPLLLIGAGIFLLGLFSETKENKPAAKPQIENKPKKNPKPKPVPIEQAPDNLPPEIKTPDTDVIESSVKPSDD